MTHSLRPLAPWPTPEQTYNSSELNNHHIQPMGFMAHQVPLDRLVVWTAVIFLLITPLLSYSSASCSVAVPAIFILFSSAGVCPHIKTHCHLCSKTWSKYYRSYDQAIFRMVTYLQHNLDQRQHTTVHRTVTKAKSMPQTGATKEQDSYQS